MSIKHPRPQDARKALKRMWSNVAVYSCADGTFRIEPTWNKSIYGVYTEKDGGGPGMFSRMDEARRETFTSKKLRVMGIRQEAAEKLARKLLELRAPRLEHPSAKFYATMARVIMLYVDMDEQRQRSEEIMKETPQNDTGERNG